MMDPINDRYIVLFTGLVPRKNGGPAKTGYRVTRFSDRKHTHVAIGRDDLGRDSHPHEAAITKAVLQGVWA